MRVPGLALLALVCLFATARPAQADATAFLGVGLSPVNHPVKGFAVGLGLLVLGFEFEYAESGEDLAEASTLAQDQHGQRAAPDALSDRGVPVLRDGWRGRLPRAVGRAVGDLRRPQQRRRREDLGRRAHPHPTRLSGLLAARRGAAPHRPARVRRAQSRVLGNEGCRDPARPEPLEGHCQVDGRHPTSMPAMLGSSSDETAIPWGGFDRVFVNLTVPRATLSWRPLPARDQQPRCVALPPFRAQCPRCGGSPRRAGHHSHLRNDPPVGPALQVRRYPPLATSPRHVGRHGIATSNLLLFPCEEMGQHGPVRCRERLGGFLKCYSRPAA